jgi:hypothetical protein
MKGGNYGKFSTGLGEMTYIMQNGELYTFAADLTLGYTGGDLPDSQAILILQVGFPETYSLLLRYIFGRFKLVRGLKAALLAKIEETPNYRIPLLENAALNDPNLAIPASLDLAHSDVHLQDPANPSSPLEILGFTWVGEITASIEVWVRDLETGEPVMRGQTIVSFTVPF